ncbi:hypothetical protein [Pedobacter sp. UYP1]
MVLKDGLVKEEGTHQKLLAVNGLYHQLWEIQQKLGGWKIKS